MRFRRRRVSLVSPLETRHAHRDLDRRNPARLRPHRRRRTRRAGDRRLQRPAHRRWPRSVAGPPVHGPHVGPPGTRGQRRVRAHVDRAGGGGPGRHRGSCGTAGVCVRLLLRGGVWRSKQRWPASRCAVSRCTTSRRSRPPDTRRRWRRWWRTGGGGTRSSTSSGGWWGSRRGSSCNSGTRPFRPALEALAHTLASDAALVASGRRPAARLALLQVPTLAIAAGAGPSGMEAAAEALARAAPHARSLVLAGATHDLDPERVGTGCWRRSSTARRAGGIRPSGSRSPWSGP
jgi:hypothetical protein